LVERIGRTMLYDLLRRAIKPESAIFDEIAIADLAEVDRGIGIERVVAELF
jgi:hypothetical protein